MTTDTAPTTVLDLLTEALTAHSATAIDDLVDDGQHEVTLPGFPGHTLTLTLAEEPDHDTTLDDFDCYGRVEWVNPYAYGPSQRPGYMDGNAEKVSLPQVGMVWWQPPADGPSRGDRDAFWRLRGMVRDLVVFGFHVLVLTATHATPDGYSRTFGPTAIGGIEPFIDRAFRADLVDDLLSELIHDMED